MCFCFPAGRFLDDGAQWLRLAWRIAAEFDGAERMYRVDKKGHPSVSAMHRRFVAVPVDVEVQEHVVKLRPRHVSAPPAARQRGVALHRSTVRKTGVALHQSTVKEASPWTSGACGCVRPACR